MDLVMWRYVWDIIESVKKGRVIVLIIYFMEEVDVLGDRVGIMVKGRFRCIGIFIRLKLRFGIGFIVNLIFNNVNLLLIFVNKNVVKGFFRYVSSYKLVVISF